MGKVQGFDMVAGAERLRRSSLRENLLVPRAGGVGFAAAERRAGKGRLLISAAVFAVAAAVASTGSAVHAQSADGVAPPVNSLNFVLTARAESNVPKLNREQINTRNLEYSDLLITPAVELSVERNLGRHRIGLQSRLGYIKYLRNSQLDSEDISVSPFANLDLPICDLFLTGRVSRRQTDLGELAYLILPSQDFAATNRETTKSATGRLTCGNEFGLQPTFEASYTEGNNSNALREFSDFRTTRIQPGLAYSTPSFGQASVYAIKQTTDLPNQINALGNEGGYSLRGAGLAYQRSVGTRLTLNGNVSYVDITPRSSVNGTQSGVNYGLDFTLLASPRLQLKGNFAREFTSTLTGFSSYQLNTNYALGVNYAATPRINFTLDGAISDREYIFDVPPPVAFITEQTIRAISAGVNYKLTRSLQVKVDAGYQERSADLPLFDYDDYFVSIGLRYSLF